MIIPQQGITFHGSNPFCLDELAFAPDGILPNTRIRQNMVKKGVLLSPDPQLERVFPFTGNPGNSSGSPVCQKGLGGARSRKTLPLEVAPMSYGMNWDLKAFFPSFGSREMKEFAEAMRKDLDRLLARARALKGLDSSTQEDWETVMIDSEKLLIRFSHYGAYIGCLGAADARNEDFQREGGAMAELEAEFDKLLVEVKRAFKTAKAALVKEFLARPGLSPISFFLGRLHETTRHMMKPEMEILAADLGIDGFSAWWRLYSQISGKMEFELELPDGRKEMRPMSQRVSLMEDPDPKVRKAAFVGGNLAWERMEDVAAHALNHIAGTRIVSNRYRKVDDILYWALQQANISKKTLEALFKAVHAENAFIRRIGKAKAAALGVRDLPWYDMEAPLPISDSVKFTWEEGVQLVETSFRRVFPELADFFVEAMRKKWVEAEARAGKRPGAFCTGSMQIEESRVFMTFNGNLGDIQTLAHEIGHGYHSHVMKGMRAFARSYPATLAESASTFAEMILTDGILSDPNVPDSRKAVVLNLSLSNGMAFLMNIPVRFEFERKFYEERVKGEVPVSRLKTLMTETQREIFGDVLSPGGEDPYFWASKLHFYLTDISFYNFPYTFGYLLSRGLFRLFKEQGNAFLPRYREFLKLSGNATAEEVARTTLGCDLEKPAFWREAIRSLEGDLILFDRLLPLVIPKKA